MNYIILKYTAKGQPIISGVMNYKTAQAKARQMKAKSPASWEIMIMKLVRVQ